MAMTLKDKAQAATDKAFKKIDSLMVNAVFTVKTTSGFSFKSGTVATVVSATKRVFVSEKLVRSADGPVKVQQLLLKSDGTDYTVYSTVSVNGKTFNIVQSVDDGFSVIVEIQNV